MRNKVIVELWLVIFTSLISNKELGAHILIIQVGLDTLENQIQTCHHQFAVSTCLIQNNSKALNHFNFSALHNTTNLQILLEPNSAELEIDTNILKEIPNLKEVRFQGMSILPKTFHSTQFLDSLIFYNCHLKNLHIPLILTTNLMNHLFIYESKMEHISQHFLKNLKHLTALSLKRDNIEVIENGAFSDLKNLKILYLAENKFTSLPNVFQDLPKLEFVDLSKNKLKVIDNKFQQLSLVKTIMLNDNAIERIEPNAFKNVKSLNTLEFSKNSLTTLGGSLTHLPKLKDLILHHNYIKEFKESVIFEHYPALETLSIWNNSLSEENLKQFASKLQKMYSNRLTVHYYNPRMDFGSQS